MTRILCIAGSPRAGGNTDAMINAFHRGALESNAQSRLVKLREWQIRGCDGCEGCDTNRHCHIEDDMQPMYLELEASDIWVLSSPVYWWNISGLLKNFIDRFQVYWGDTRFKERCKTKKAVILTCGGQSNQHNTEAETYLKLFCAKLHIHVIASVRTSADAPGTVSEDILKQCFKLGKTTGNQSP